MENQKVFLKFSLHCCSIILSNALGFSFDSAMNVVPFWLTVTEIKRKFEFLKE